MPLRTAWADYLYLGKHQGITLMFALAMSMGGRNPLATGRSSDCLSRRILTLDSKGASCPTRLAQDRNGLSERIILPFGGRGK